MFEALATFTAYASYPALDCLSQNFVLSGQAITTRGKQKLGLKKSEGMIFIKQTYQDIIVSEMILKEGGVVYFILLNWSDTPSAT